MKKLNEPFAFWLIKELFGSQGANTDEVQPMSKKEVYLWMVIISVVFFLVSLLVKTFIA